MITSKTSLATCSGDNREAGYTVVDKLREIAVRRETTPARVALAWLLAKPYVASIILGASKRQQFSENVKAIDLELSQEDVEVLDALTMPKSLYPYGLIARGGDGTVQQALRR